MSGFSPFWFGGDPTKQSIWNPWVNQGKGEGETGECIHLRSHHARRSPPLFIILMCDFFSFSICWRLWAQSPGTRRHTQEERERGGRVGETRLVHVLPHTINPHTHTWFFAEFDSRSAALISRWFLFYLSMGQNHRLTSGKQSVTVLLVSNLVTQICSDSISFFDKFLSWATWSWESRFSERSSRKVSQAYPSFLM